MAFEFRDSRVAQVYKRDDCIFRCDAEPLLYTGIKSRVSSTPHGRKSHFFCREQHILYGSSDRLNILNLQYVGLCWLFCYRRNDDGQVEFTGENTIDHTPRDETIRIYTGNSFDLSGERRRTTYAIDMGKSMATETFEIKVRNHKKEPVEVRVVEHLYRGKNWEITTKSDEYQKKDSQTVEFPITVMPDGEKVITYTAHYTW